MKEKGVPLLRSIWTSSVLLTCAEELKRIPYHFYLTACVCSEFEVLAYASRCFSLQPLLPSPCTSGDAARLLQDIFKSSVHSLAHVFCESIAVSDRFLQNCKDPFQQLMHDKAKTVGYIKLDSLLKDSKMNFAIHARVLSLSISSESTL